MMSGNHLAADLDVVRLHDGAARLALRLQSTLDQMKFTDGYALTRGALWSIWADALSLHQAVRSLCDAGYALATPLLLRTLLELYMGTVVIVNADADAEYLAFKYMCSFLVEAVRDSDFPEPQRTSARLQLEQLVQSLPSALQERGRAFAAKDKPGQYWYNPEFRGPADVLRQYAKADLAVIYRRLSGPTHGGFAGLRLYKDHPDTISPKPRSDPYAHSRALLESARFLVELSVVRAKWDHADDLTPEFAAWFRWMEEAAPRLLAAAVRRTDPSDSDF